jgi:hypothetical protein
MAGGKRHYLPAVRLQQAIMFEKLHLGAAAAE